MPPTRFPGPCSMCGGTDPSGYYKHQMCNNCYRKEKRRARGLRQGGFPAQEGPCIICGSTTSSNGRFVKGMCRNCYKRVSRGGNLVPRTKYTGPCLECGTTTAKHYFHKLCSRCYRKKQYEEKVKSIKRYCADCGTEISRLSRTGRCRNCYGQWRYQNDEEYREKMKKRYLAYLKTPKGKAFSSKKCKERYLRIHDVDNCLSDQEWNLILEFFGHCCAYCYKPLQPHEVIREHVIPLSKHGTHDIYNVVPSCQSCNAKKRDNPPPFPVITLGQFLDEENIPFPLNYSPSR